MNFDEKTAVKVIFWPLHTEASVLLRGSLMVWIQVLATRLDLVLIQALVSPDNLSTTFWTVAFTRIYSGLSWMVLALILFHAYDLSKVGRIFFIGKLICIRSIEVILGSYYQISDCSRPTPGCKWPKWWMVDRWRFFPLVNLCARCRNRGAMNF